MQQCTQCGEWYQGGLSGGHLCTPRGYQSPSYFNPPHQGGNYAQMFAEIITRLTKIEDQLRYLSSKEQDRDR